MLIDRKKYNIINKIKIILNELKLMLINIIWVIILFKIFCYEIKLKFVLVKGIENELIYCCIVVLVM